MDDKFQILIPTVTETGARGERVFDIYSLLLKERIIFLFFYLYFHILNLLKLKFKSFWFFRE